MLRLIRVRSGAFLEALPHQLHNVHCTAEQQPLLYNIFMFCAYLQLFAY
jgi:hypothetical protein